MTIIIDGQKAFGKKHNIKDVFEYYKLKLGRKYPAALVLEALDEYTDRHNDIPAPSDIIGILSPQKPRITEAEFVQAHKWQENNGYPIFSEALDVINGYKEQEQCKRSEYKVKCEKIAAITKQAGENMKCLPR